MKSDFHFHFYSRIVIMAVLAVSLVFIQKSVTTIASDPPGTEYKINGWAWNIKAGWLSLNCYNDFVVPGTYINRCADGVPPGLDYGLTTNRTVNPTKIEGCIWAGNYINSSENLGWVCFNDPNPSKRPNAVDGFGVATSTNYVNALDENTYASILKQEHFICAGTPIGVADYGNPCDPNNHTCSSGSCIWAGDDAWKLGFPISSPILARIQEPAGSTRNGDPDYPSATYCNHDNTRPCVNDSWCAAGDTCGNPIYGCFNCYQVVTFICDDGVTDCAPGPEDWINPNPLCPVNPPGAIGICHHGLSWENCDNCLEYFYYTGQCIDDNGVLGVNQNCRKTDDCASDEICQPISTCSNDIEHTCSDNSNCNFGAICQIVAGVGGICSGNHEASCTDAADCIGGTCIERETGSLKKVIGAYECTDCDIQSQSNVCGQNSQEKNLNSCLSCPADKMFYTPGVMIDNNHYNLVDGPLPAIARDEARLCGWAWNAWEDVDNNLHGLGWFQFGPRVVTTTRPFLSVKEGNIYSEKSITGKYLPPFGYWNASYLIESGGSITNFISSSTLNQTFQGEFAYRSKIGFLEKEVETNKYTNALGSLDYYGLTEDFSGGFDYNKYGAKIYKKGVATSGVEPTTDKLYMNEGVLYYVNGLNIEYDADNLVLEALAWPYPDGSQWSGIIAVDGDATINRNVVYGAPFSGIKTLKNIPSVVWIIRGDLHIGPKVTSLAGTFIVLGNPAVVPSCDPLVPGCGQVVTCYTSPLAPSACDDNTLTIYGNVLARYFNLNRTYASSAAKAPAENFINDGRLQANPPPGLEDFSDIMPRFTEN